MTEPIWKVYETREKKGGITGGALSGYTDWTPAADTAEYKTELYYPGDADLVILKMETKYMTGQKLHCMQMIMVDTKLEKRNIWMPHP